MRKSTLAIHASTASLTTARALSSHARKRYMEQYRGRYRRPALVFAFDAALAGAVVILLVAALYFFQAEPPPPPGIGLVLSAQPIVSGAPTPFDVAIISRDAKTRHGLRLTWMLPEGTEVLSSDPPLAKSGSSSLGDLAPGETKHARIIVRMFVPSGGVRLGFEVQDGTERLTGIEIRPVDRSGLRTLPLPSFTALTEGARIPFILRNDTALSFDHIELVINGARINGKQRILLSDMSAWSERSFLLEPIARDVSVRVVSRRVQLSSVSWHFEKADAFPANTFSIPPATPGEPTRVHLSTRAPLRLLVFHPALKDAEHGVRVFDLSKGEQTIELPLTSAPTAVDSWFAVLFDENGEALTLGPVAENRITTPFSVTAEARYYGANGDQLGVGPWPPKKGETTKLWIQWKFLPTSTDLSNAEIRAPLPAGVQLTGREALPDGGAVTSESGDAIWRIPFLPASSEGASVSFEISVTPSARRAIPFLGETRASALENRSQIPLQSSAPALDSNVVK